MYTENQKEAARQTDMIDFLSRFEGFTFKRAGNEYHCIEHNSLVVMNDRKGWYWNSQDIGGATAIDYCIKIHGMKFPEALKTIVGLPELQQVPHRKPITASVEPLKELKLPPKCDGKYSRAYAYLTKTRMLDGEIVAELMSRKMIYQDDRGNCVFVGYDESGKERFACLRGTAVDTGKPAFRGDCEGSDKQYAFRIEGEDKNRIYVFEAPIDLISHATLANEVLQDKDAWRKHSRLCLSGKSNLALEHYLSVHKDCKEIVLCLDDDKTAAQNWGQLRAQKLQKEYSTKGYDVRINKPRNNDFNDDLTAYKRLYGITPETKAKTKGLAK